MPTPIRIKRSTGSSAPPSLLNAELSFSEGGGGTLYIGVGTGGENGTATSVLAIGGPGTFATTSSLSSYVTSSSLNTTLGSYVTSSSLNTTLGSYVTSSSLTTTLGDYVTSSNLTTTLGGYATTSALNSAVNGILNAAPSTLDTLKELADALGSDANFSTTVTNALSARLVATNNLNDVANVTLARSNLQLGSMATQAANNVAITGGTIDGVTFDGGSY